MRDTTTVTRGITLIGLVVSGLTFGCAGPAPDADRHSTIILVRHSEKEDAGQDPALSAAGRARAHALAHALGEVEIDAIYATQFARTQQTVEPLADRIGLDVIPYTAGADYVTEMVTLLRSEHEGHTVVVASHSNTVPAIIEGLGATPVPIIDEDEYDDLYVVTLRSHGRATVLALRYGVETP